MDILWPVEGVKRREGMKHLYTAPPAFGCITKLEVKDGRILAHTESGIPVIVPSRQMEQDAK